MSPSTSIPSKNVFEIGDYSTTLITVEQKTCSRNNNNASTPPKPLLICSPLEEGVFPVLLFLHGYLLYNSFYSHLLQHIASHGFIVVAPQVTYATLLSPSVFFFIFFFGFNDVYRVVAWRSCYFLLLYLLSSVNVDSYTTLGCTYHKRKEF